MPKLTMTEKKHVGSRDIVVLFFIVALLCVGSFVVENRTIFGSLRNAEMNDLECFLSCFLYGVVFAGFLWSVHRFHPIPIKRGWLALFYVLFFANTLAIWFFPGVYDTGVLIYQLGVISEIRYTVFSLVIYSLLYVIFAMIPELTAGSRIYEFLFAVTVGLVLLSIAYSYVTEASLYAFIFQNGGPEDAYAVPKSWAGHRNIYAFMLFHGLVAEAYLEVRRPHPWRWVIMLFIFVQNFFVLSKTSFTISVLFLLAFYVWHFVKTLKHHPKRNWILLGCLSAAFLLILLSAIIYKDDSTFYLSRYAHSITQLMADSVVATMLDRFYVWFDIIRCISVFPLTFLIGGGASNWIHMAYAYLAGDPDAYYPIDSAWVTDLGRGGLLGLLYLTGITLFVFFVVIKGIHRKSPLALPSLFYLVCLLFHSFVETGDLTYPDVSGIVFAVLAYLPLASEEAALKDPRGQDYRLMAFQTYPGKPYPKDPKTDLFVAKRVFLWLAPVCASLAGTWPTIALLTGIPVLSSTGLYVSLCFVSLVLPFLVLGSIFLARSHHIYGCVTLSFWTVAYVALSVVLPIYSDTWLSPLFACAFGLVLAITVLFSGILPSEINPLCVRYVGIMILLAALNRFVAYASGLVTVYFVLISAGINIALTFALATFWPSLFLPGALWVDKLNDHLLYQGVRYGLRSEVAYRQVYGKKEKTV